MRDLILPTMPINVPCSSDLWFMSVFIGELEAIDRVDVEAPLAAATHRWPLFYADVYREAAKRAQGEGQVDQENVYRFLERVMNIMPTFHNREQPYSPYFTSNTYRSEIPSDFTSVDIDAIRRTLIRATDQTLRAHLNDMLLVGPPGDHSAGAEAAPLFLQIGKGLKGTGNPSFMKEALQRGIQLSRQMGWRKALGENARAALIEVIRTSGKAPFDNDLFFGLQLAHEESIGDSREWRELAIQGGEYHKAQGQYNDAQSYFEMALAFSQLLNDLDAERSAWREMGAALECQAHERATQPNGSFMAATGILKESIQALRKGKAPSDAIDALLGRLREYQASILDNNELGSYGRDFDVTTHVNAVRDNVSGRSLRAALLRLAFASKLTDPEELRKRVQDHAKKFPLLYLLQTRVIDDKGRDRHVQRGILDLQGEEREKALKQRMFADVQFDWNFRVQTVLEPARRQILEEHSPRQEDLRALVVNNPFVPPGHEGLFLRGLLAGLYGDFVLSSHLLVPQFENSLRYVLESKGIHVANILDNGTEPLKVWGGILDIPESRELFGESRLFELEGLLVSESGLGFRNKLAHGMLTEAQSAFSVATVHSWWLMLHLCMEQVVHRFEEPCEA
ncbi:MAG TPA: DUF4209 domain-containing protein [Flavobacteriales bacterium]